MVINFISNLFNHSILKNIEELLTFIENYFDNLLIILVIQYFTLLILLKIILGIIQFLFHYAKILLDIGYAKLISGRTFLIIKFFSELLYMIDKILNRITPRVIPYYSVFTLSPIRIILSFKNILLKPFRLSFTNFLVWIVLLLHYFYNSFKLVNLESVISYFKDIDYKFINAVSSVTLLLMSFIIIFLFRSSFIQAKAKKKIYDDMYEQIFKQQLIISTNLSKILIKSKKNIELLGKQLDYLTKNYCRDLTSGNYYWENNQLIKDTYKFPLISKDQSPFMMYEDFTQEQTLIWESLQEINTSRLISIFYKVNKPIRFELIRLCIYPNIQNLYLDRMLLNKKKLQELYENRVKNCSYIYDLIRKSVDNEDYLKINEAILTKEIIDFHDLLQQMFEESIYLYIVGVQCVDYLEDKSSLKLKDWLLNK